MKYKFRDQARCILQSHAVEQSVEEAEKTCITEDGFARIYASDLVIVIQPEEEVMHISTLDPPKSFTHNLCEWDEMSVLEFPAPDLDYILWVDHLKRALFEIIELLESPDTSSETKLPDEIASIIEADKGIVNCCLKNNVLFLGKNDAGLKGQVYEFCLSSEAVNYRVDNGPWKHSSALQYISSHPSEEWSNIVLQLVCELEKRSPENEEVFQLRQQVEELQGRLSEFEKPLEEQLAEKEAEFESLCSEKDSCNSQISTLKNQAMTLSGEIDCVQHELTALRHRVWKQSKKGVTSDS